MTREPTPALYATRGPNDLEVAAIRKELAGEPVRRRGGQDRGLVAAGDGHRTPRRYRCCSARTARRADRQPTPERRIRFIVSRLMLRATAGALLGADPALFEIAYTATGRPHLRGCDELDISVGDCEGLVAVGLMDGGRVGVDVAPLRPPPLRLPSVEHLLTRYELERLRAAPPSARHPLLLRFPDPEEFLCQGHGKRAKDSVRRFRIGDGRRRVSPHGEGRALSCARPRGGLQPFRLHSSDFRDRRGHVWVACLHPCRWAQGWDRK